MRKRLGWRQIFLPSVIILLLLMVHVVEAQEDERLKELRKHHHDLYSVSVINGQKIWAVGAMGIILHSFDGGKNWEIQETKVLNSLNSVVFENEKIGSIVGERGIILETKNGGKDWEIKQQNKKYHLFAAAYTKDKGYLYAVGNFGTILVKKNLESDWKDMSIDKDVILNDIFFLNDNVGWIAGELGFLLKTDTGGKVWNEINIFSGREEEKPFIYSINFKNEEEGLLTLPGKKILLTEDGFKSWKSLSRKHSFYSSLYKDGKWYFVGGGGIEIFNTFNDSWSTPDFFAELNQVGLLLISGKWNNGDGWFVGKGGTIIKYRQTNGWEKLHPTNEL